MHKYAVVIAARNEEKVIGNLLDSIKQQDYPSELVTTFVVADNCTDKTQHRDRPDKTFQYSVTAGQIIFIIIGVIVQTLRNSCNIAQIFQIAQRSGNAVA